MRGSDEGDEESPARESLTRFQGPANLSKVQLTNSIYGEVRGFLYALDRATARVAQRRRRLITGVRRYFCLVPIRLTR